MQYVNIHVRICPMHNYHKTHSCENILYKLSIKCSYLPLHDQSDCEHNFGVILVESGGFLQIHAGGGIRCVAWNFDCELDYVWLDTGGTPLNLMAGTLGLLARTAGRVSWKTGAHLKRDVRRFRAN